MRKTKLKIGKLKIENAAAVTVSSPLSMRTAPVQQRHPISEPNSMKIAKLKIENAAAAPVSPSLSVRTAPVQQRHPISIFNFQFSILPNAVEVCA
ncbi:MAG TPA: hypothetical protein VFO89_00735 [Thermoanaerobaculia bacterium]|nr:hypothetical protein [Thermoanaerobaculia bacterium]